MEANKYTKYRFLLAFDNQEKQVYPIIKKDDGLEMSMSKDDRYVLTKWNGVFTFQRDDFETINAQDFDTDFKIKVQRKNRDGGWFTIFNGIFNKTDCDFDINQKRIKARVRTDDYTTKFIENLEKEFDIIELGAERNTITYEKQPLIQVYRRWATKITNFYKGQSYDSDVTPVWSHDDLINKYHFGDPLDIAEIEDTGLVPDISGKYLKGLNKLPLLRNDSDYSFNYNTGESIRLYVNSTDLDDFDDYESVWQDDNLNTYEIKGVYIDIELNRTVILAYQLTDVAAIPNSGNLTHISGAINTSNIVYFNNEDTSNNPLYRRVSVLDKNDSDTVVYLSDTIKDEGTYSGDPIEPIPFNEESEIVLYSLTSDSIAIVNYGSFYFRLLTDITTSSESKDIPEDDVTGGNYRKVIPIEINNYDPIVINSNIIESDGDFGQIRPDAEINSNKFFQEPNNGVINLPLYISDWRNNSFWLKMDSFVLQYIVFQTRIELRDAYTLKSVLQSILNDINIGVSFDESSLYSDFFYSDYNPITGNMNNELMITPKSNIIAGAYDTAASRAKIKLAELLNFLKSAYNVFWYITDDGKLKLEHDVYFWNGGSYEGQATQYDITELLDSRNGKKLSYGTNKYTYRKEEIPERIRTKWMDKVSKVFEGRPVEMISKYVDKGNIRDVSISKFTTDIEFIQAKPNDISKDGFCAFEVFNGKMVFSNLLTGYSAKPIQNGVLSLLSLSENYFLNPQPTPQIKVNKKVFNVSKITRNKEQSLSLPMLFNIDILKLIKTEIGKGKIESLSYSIVTNQMKLKIYYVTQ